MNDLILSSPKPSSVMSDVAKSRAVQEVQAALIVAKNYPRDQTAAYLRIIESCKRPSLAEKAMYSYKRSNNIISGPSIRLAEVAAQNWGNLDFGIRELERRPDSSVAESYCWDMETNTRSTKTFEVMHAIQKKDGSVKVLTDQRDIYELVANYGARRLRACIMAVIPGDIIESAVNQCKKTLASGDGEPVLDRARKLVAAFKQYFGVSLQMIERRLDHKLELITADEFVDLHGIYNSLKDKVADKTEFFVSEELTPQALGAQADAEKEIADKKKACEMFEAKIKALLISGITEQKILETLGASSFSDVTGKDSKYIFNAIEAL